MSDPRPARIRILPEAVASRIAAGEVIERPASVVRELLDNALDAGARKISLRLDLPGGGAGDADFWKHFALAVSDDGCGMHPEDLTRSFAKHATSKILDIEDVFTTPTLGFRGEALAAIASVARVEALSADDDSGEGCRLRLEGGAFLSREGAASPRGTRLRVADLFYNAPARRKFLRSPQAERSEIRREFLHRSLGHPGVHFVMETAQAGEKPEVDVEIPATLDLRGRIERFWGAEIAASLLPLDSGEGPLRISGFITSHRHRARNRSSQFFFHKRRPIVNATLSAALSHAYLNLLPSRVYPACFLTLQFPDHDVDVNVHPQKRDVRFRDPDSAYRLVHGAVKETLRASLEGKATSGTIRSEPMPAGRPNIFSFSDGGGPVSYPSFSVGSGNRTSTPEATGLSPQSQPIFGDGSGAPFTGKRVLGQVDHLFIVFTDGPSLILADQHALHERIHFDRLKKKMEAGPGVTQPLLSPLIYSRPRTQIDTLHLHADALKSVGFVLSPFGEGAAQIEEIPVWIPVDRVESVAFEFLDRFLENPGMGPADLREHALATAACHLSVRAGEPLSMGVMQDLIDSFYREGHADVCPHGRPFLYRLGGDTLRRYFDRPVCGRGLGANLELDAPAP
jgi:DNA mismatch repair protein MutL